MLFARKNMRYVTLNDSELRLAKYALLPVRLGFRRLNDRIRTVFDNRPEFFHVGTFTLLPGLKNIT